MASASVRALVEESRFASSGSDREEARRVGLDELEVGRSVAMASVVSAAAEPDSPGTLSACVKSRGTTTHASMRTDTALVKRMCMYVWLLR